LRKEQTADTENKLSNLLPKIIHTINIFDILAYAVWDLGRKMFTNSDFSHVRKSFGTAGQSSMQSLSGVVW